MHTYYLRSNLYTCVTYFINKIILLFRNDIKREYNANSPIKTLNMPSINIRTDKIIDNLECRLVLDFVFYYYFYFSVHLSGTISKSVYTFART